MKTAEMKAILAQKLADEESSLKSSDITIEQTDDTVKIVISGYEHVPFIITKEYDEYFGYILYVNCDDEAVAFMDSKTDYDWKYAMLEIGYYIGTRF